MKKAILFKDGEIKHMTFEEVLDQFERMINRFATQALDKIVFNKPDREEIIQELQLQTWEAYRRYNGENAFSTYLYYRLQHGIHRSTMKLYAQKRTNKKGVESLNKLLGSESDGEELENILGEDDFELVSYEFREFMSHLDKILDPCEKKILRVLMDKGDTSVQDLAAQLGISRQGANKKVNKFREKLEKIMLETGFVPSDIRKLQAV
ncbi:MAG TPA: sigma-70 family RNA polymerase sigma factor [Pseudoneobacillus sp.]|nr:sigma-70 family RNA polymerase sigma factor [Pseudoneobacillus sp.]